MQRARPVLTWLNIDVTEGQQASLADVKSNWIEIDNLVLSSSCDAGCMKAVRQSLMRYEPLLRAVGCKTITYPTVARPELQQGQSTFKSLRGLRAAGKMLDVTFRTEGKEIKAHRLVLAAVSEKCAGQWSGRFPIEDVITFDEEEDPDTFLSYHTLSTMIDFAYEEDIDWTVMQASVTDDPETTQEKLDMLLELVKGADYWIIPTLASEAEDRIISAARLFININNCVETLERADFVGAKTVALICQEFIQQNEATVDRANGSQ
jgi:sacsin